MRAARSGAQWAVRVWVRLPWQVRACAPVLVMGVLWFASSRTPAPRPPSVWRDLAHNGMHVVAYGCLGGAFLLAGRAHPQELDDAWPRKCIMASAFYGLVDEVHQAFVPRRVASLADLVSDVGGAMLAVSLLTWLLGVAGRPRIRWSALVCVAGVAAATWLPC